MAKFARIKRMIVRAYVGTGSRPVRHFQTVIGSTPHCRASPKGFMPSARSSASRSKGLGFFVMMLNLETVVRNAVLHLCAAFRLRYRCGDPAGPAFGSRAPRQIRSGTRQRVVGRDSR